MSKSSPDLERWKSKNYLTKVKDLCYLVTLCVVITAQLVKVDREFLGLILGISKYLSRAFFGIILYFQTDVSKYFSSSFYNTGG